MTNLNSQLTEVLQGIRSEIKVDTDGKAPTKVKKQYVDKSGKPQTTYVPAYPLDFAPIIKNAIELGFSS